MNIVLKILRFQPEKAAEPYFEKFELDADPESRLLDVLVWIQRRVDPTLALRKSCAHGVCGSDAMVINGTERLACKTLVKDVAAADGTEVTIEPLRSLPVIRDLVVGQERFFETYRGVKPFLVGGDKPPDGREQLQTPEEHRKIEEATDCILCASCFSACPVIRSVNPASSVRPPSSRPSGSRRTAGTGDSRSGSPCSIRPTGSGPARADSNAPAFVPAGLKSPSTST